MTRSSTSSSTTSRLEPGEGRPDLRELLARVGGNAPGFGLIGVAGLVFAACGLMGAVRKRHQRRV